MRRTLLLTSGARATAATKLQRIDGEHLHDAANAEQDEPAHPWTTPAKELSATMKIALLAAFLAAFAVVFVGCGGGGATTPAVVVA